MSSVSSNLQLLLPPLCCQLVASLPISQESRSDSPNITSKHYLPVPMFSNFRSHPLWLLKDVVPASVPFLLQCHQVFPLYWTVLVSVQAFVIFPFEKQRNKKTQKTLISTVPPFMSFPLQQNLRTLFPLSVVSLLPFSLKPSLLRLSPPPLHPDCSNRVTNDSIFLSCNGSACCSPNWSVSTFSIYALGSPLCFWRMEWGSGFMKSNLWDMNKPIYRKMSYSYSPICFLWVNDDLWQSSSQEC